MNHTTHLIAFTLMAIGGLNWLLVGVADMNLVSALFGEGTAIARLVYILVGLATIVEILSFKRHA